MYSTISRMADAVRDPTDLYRWIGHIILLGALGAIAAPDPATAQVSGTVDIRDSRGQALVRNSTLGSVRVEVALWESNEAREGVELVRRANGNVWPTAFDLAPGERQVVRVLLSDDSYAAGAVLRLETRLVPHQPTQHADGNVSARILLATRILSKVLVH